MKTASPAPRTTPDDETASPANVHYLKLVPTEPNEPDEPRAPYSVDITQPDPKGFVHIDACVPMSLAVAFMNLVTTYKPDAD